MVKLNISRLAEPTYVARTPIFSLVILLLNKNDGNLRNHFFFSNQTSPEEHFEDNTLFLKKNVLCSLFRTSSGKILDFRTKDFLSHTNKILPSIMKIFQSKFFLGYWEYGFHSMEQHIFAKTQTTFVFANFLQKISSNCSFAHVKTGFGKICSYFLMEVRQKLHVVALNQKKVSEKIPLTRGLHVSPHQPKFLAEIKNRLYFFDFCCSWKFARNWFSWLNRNAF